GPDQNVCAGTPVVLGGSPAATGGTAPYTYRWAPDVGLDNASASNPHATPSTTTRYVLEVTDSFGCAAMDTVVVNIYPEPHAAAGEGRTICASGSVRIGGDPTASQGTPPFVYEWTPAAGLSDAHSANPMASPAKTTLYTVHVSDAHGCAANDTVSV